VDFYWASLENGPQIVYPTHFGALTSLLAQFMCVPLLQFMLFGEQGSLNIFTFADYAIILF
jgi:hypothetical protein